MLANRICAAAMLMLSAQLIGCDRGTSTSSPPVVIAPIADASTQPTTLPSAVLNIDGKPTQFPSAKLVLTKKSGGIRALLCSDDPATAIESNYAGNSFMLDMKLEIENPQDLASAVWQFKTVNQGTHNSTNGIFLNGARRQMQPADVKVTFEKDGDQVVASLSGQFLLLDSHDTGAAPKTVDVSGRLSAVVLEQ
jgi:hypothetical protein